MEDRRGTSLASSLFGYCSDSVVSPACMTTNTHTQAAASTQGWQETNRISGIDKGQPGAYGPCYAAVPVSPAPVLRGNWDRLYSISLAPTVSSQAFLSWIDGGGGRELYHTQVDPCTAVRRTHHFWPCKNCRQNSEQGKHNDLHVFTGCCRIKTRH